MQLAPEQPDDEVVVVPVEPVAGEPDVVAETGAPERQAHSAVLHQDRVLLLSRELLERAVAAQRIPDRPAKRGIEHAAARPLDERLVEILLVPERVRAPQHGQLRLRPQLAEGSGSEQRPGGGDERVRALAQRQDRDTFRIVHVLVEDGVDLGRGQRITQRGAVARAAKRIELHVEPAVERGRLPVRGQPVLGDVDLLEALLLRPLVDTDFHTLSWSQRAASVAW